MAERRSHSVIFKNRTYGDEGIEYFSQGDQDRLFIQSPLFFKGKYKGTFIELGAHNGITLSNTYSLEKFRNWRGLCIEPHPILFAELEANRPLCINENALIGVEDEEETFLFTNHTTGGHLMTAMSGIEKYHKSLDSMGEEINKIQMKVTPLSYFIRKYGLYHVNILSIDVEGAEYSVLNSIDWDETQIDVIVVEMNEKEDEIRAMLVEKSYIEVVNILGDGVFVHVSFMPANHEEIDMTLFWWNSFI